MHYQDFWRAIMDWSGLRREGLLEPACLGTTCATATFFPHVRLNYVENLLSDGGHEDGERPATTSLRSDGGRHRLSRAEVQEEVRALAWALADLGLRVGDRVGVVARNDADAVLATLSAAAVGACVATASPEMGVEGIVDRLGQIEPTVLFAHAGPALHDAGMPVATRVSQIVAALPSLRMVVTLDGGATLPGVGLAMHSLRSLIARGAGRPFEWERFPFNHPLFVMFSSGTTGRPKCIVHGAGGTLIEHVKEHRLHCDLRAGDKLFFQTACSWMMWHWQLSALASGAEIVLYDGPLMSERTLWEIVSAERVTVFGTSPSYLALCQSQQLNVRQDYPLERLRAILSTGSVLHERQYAWVRDQVKPVPLQSISGGTDIIGCFVLGNPNLPVRAGWSQCRSLGLDVRAAGPGPVGELVCVNPFPSRPLGFANDPDGARFRAAYFGDDPGVWTHGDLIEFGPDGMARMHGRSDGVLNVRGIRVGPAEIYDVLHGFPEISEGVAVEQAGTGPDEGRLVLVLALRGGGEASGDLGPRIRRELFRRRSAAHVPDVILAVPELPVTHSGKVSAAAAAAAVNSRAVANAGALRNPGCLDAIRDHPALRRAAMLGTPPGTVPADLREQLRSLWEELLGIAPIGLDDDFFELGGNSLLSARLTAEIRRRTGRELPLATLFYAPTITLLAGVVEDGAWTSPSSRLVRLKAGDESQPCFLVHSIAGTVLELWAVARNLSCGRAAYGIQARGVDLEQEPHASVEEMACDYIEAMRAAQPHGPYRLGGYSFGGLVALEMAQQLAAQGEALETVVLIDTDLHDRELAFGEWLRSRAARARREVRALRAAGRRWPYFLARARSAVDRAKGLAGRAPQDAKLPNQPVALQRVRGALRRAFVEYRPRPYSGRLTLIRAAAPDPCRGTFLRGWSRLSGGRLNVLPCPGDHFSMIAEPNAAALAALLDREWEEKPRGRRRERTDVPRNADLVAG